MKRRRGATRQVGGGFLIDPRVADLYESLKPFQRYKKLLIGHAAFPGIPPTSAEAYYTHDVQSPFHIYAETTEVYFIVAGELVGRVNGRRYGVR